MPFKNKWNNFFKQETPGLFKNGHFKNVQKWLLQDYLFPCDWKNIFQKSQMMSKHSWCENWNITKRQFSKKSQKVQKKWIFGKNCWDISETSQNAYIKVKMRKNGIPFLEGPKKRPLPYILGFFYIFYKNVQDFENSCFLDEKSPYNYFCGSSLQIWSRS
jgi:hypothetical protein